MSRSSFFGYAITSTLVLLPAVGFGHLAPIPGRPVDSGVRTAKRAVRKVKT